MGPAFVLFFFLFEPKKKESEICPACSVGAIIDQSDKSVNKISQQRRDG